MDFKILHLLKNRDSLWINIIFYLLCALLTIVVFTYFIIMFKVSIQNKEIIGLGNKITNYGVGQEKAYEKKVLDYKKKIDDYSVIINRRKISLNLFSFIEEKTLSNVWFSNFSMLQSTNQIKLSGEAEDMEILGRQIQAFERSQDYIKNIDVLYSTVEPSGKIKFTLNLSLNPKVFTYKSTSESFINNP